MKTIKLTEADCQNVTWQVVEVGDGFRRSVGHGTHPVTGVPITVQKTEFLAEDELLKLNAERRHANSGRRWSSGLGSDKGGNLPIIPVASIPLNKLFDEIAPRMREGDKDHLKWWLNQERNAPFRTREGKL